MPELHRDRVMPRRWMQVVATLLSNAYWLFPWTRSLYTGPLKAVCVPGLNCYSCPAATGACPLGALQTFMASVRPAFQAGRIHLGLYVIGFLGMLGSLVGRMPCAWLCPFGLLQEIVHKIPSPKFEIPHPLTYGKYAMLALFVFLLPLVVVDEFGYGLTWFCQFVCPAGTLEAGLPLMGLKPELRSLIGTLFFSKLTILVAVVIWMVVARRPFCRVLCPLGAIYSLFNRHSLFRMIYIPENCTHCRTCYRDCPMGVRFYEGANQKDCIRCLKCLQTSCRFGAIGYSLGGTEVGTEVFQGTSKNA